MSTKKTIAKSFTVSTIEDGVSVQAQYAPNANPTSGQIHTVWQNGDLYMRTRESDESAWSSWHKIVGENGDETDYTFNISQEKTSASATTEPSNCYYNAWQDAPITATAQYPYLWMKVVKKEWSQSTQTYVSGTPSYVRVTGEESIDYSIDGALNSIKLRAGETSTAVSCVYTFYQKPAASATRSTVSCYYAVYLRSGSAFSLLTMNSGYTNHGSGTSVDVRANVPYNSENTIYDAVVIYTFASEYYNTNPESQSYMAKKEIPIIKDGKNGDKGDLISFTNTLTSIIIECDSDGLSLAASTKTGLIALYVNGSQLPPITLTMVSKPTSLTVTTSGSGIPAGGFSVSWSSGVNMANLQGTIVLRASSTGYRAEISIPVMCTKNGERGKIGRFYYYAGAWSDYSSTDTFDVTDTQAPFFLYNNNYWVYNPDSNGTYTKSSMGTPSSSSSNWKMMESNFTYLITRAIFGDYAHFGSAIINGDWMISQHGTYGGNTPIDYTKFDPAYPSTSVYTNHTVNGTTWLGYNFVPNYAVDLLTGKTYMTSAEVRGTIRADNLYHGITFAARASDGGNVYTSHKWYCMPSSIYGKDGYDAQSPRPSYYNNFSIYNYYTDEEITTMSGGALTAPENHGFLMCVGDNDNVYVLPDSYNRFPTIYLPAPEDVQGKVVDVFGFNYGTPSSVPTFEVKNVGNPNSGMTPLIYYDASENKWKAVQSGGTARITVATNAAMRFISTGVTVGSTTTWWWLAVPFYKKEWTSS